MMQIIKLLSLAMALMTGTALADSDQAIANYLAALKAEDYEAAAKQLAYPSFKSDEDLAARQQAVLNTITAYHATLGKLVEAPAKGSPPGERLSLGISGGTEDFVMNNPATDYRQIAARFSTAGIVYLTFMLADYNGATRIIYIQYDYVNP